MDAIVALALVLVGFALGGALVFWSLRRTHTAELSALHRRVDELGRVVSMHGVTQSSGGGANAGHAQELMHADTAQMDPYRPLASLRIPAPATTGWGSSMGDVSMPGSLVAPPIPGMTPPDEGPSPHEAMTHPPVSAPASASVRMVEVEPTPIVAAPLRATGRPSTVVGALPPSAPALQSALPTLPAQGVYVAPSGPSGFVSAASPSAVGPPPSHSGLALSGPTAVPSAPAAHVHPSYVPSASVAPPPSASTQSPTASRSGPATVHRSVPPARQAGGVPSSLPTERKSTLPSTRVRAMDPLAAPPAPAAIAPLPPESATMLERDVAEFDALAQESRGRRPERRDESRELRTEPRVEAPEFTRPEPIRPELNRPVSSRLTGVIDELPRFPSTPLGRPGRSVDSTVPIALDAARAAPKARRDDDEVTQLDPLEPELMARLQGPAPGDLQPLPSPSTSVEKSSPRRFEEPALPARVTATGGVVRGRDANTNVLEIEENAWPDVGAAGSGGAWELDNLLGEFARDVEQSGAGGRGKR